jgi:choline transport protein
LIYYIPYDMSSGISPPLHLASCNEAAQDISADELQLRAQGHVQELPRQFSTFSILSLSFSITNSWIGYSAVFATPLYSGGGPGVIYCLLGASVACSFITAGLAELASAFPSAGGQYQ